MTQRRKKSTYGRAQDAANKLFGEAEMTQLDNSYQMDVTTTKTWKVRSYLRAAWLAGYRAGKRERKSQ